MGAKISKRYFYYKSQRKLLKLSLIFFLIVLPKLHLGFLNFSEFVRFVNMGPYRSEVQHFKPLLLLQIKAQSF